MSAARRELYLYYRVAQAHWRDATDAVMRWQREVCLAHPGLVARVLRRPGEADDVVTLMEVYAGSPTTDATFEATVARGAPALGPWLIGARHVERFDVLD